MRSNEKKSASLRENAVWNVLGSLLYAGCQWGILVATVKLSTAQEVGKLSLGFAISAPVFLLLHLRLRAASATDASQTYTTADYIALRLLCTVLALLITFGICVASGLPGASTAIVMWIALAKTIESGSDLMYGFAQQVDELRFVAVSLAARGVLACALFAGLLWRTQRLDIALAGLCAAWALVFFCFDLRATPKFDLASATFWKAPASLWRLTRLTLPLGVSTMFMSLAANMPRYFIERSLGLEALGIFSAASYMTMTISLLVSAIAEASIAPLSRHFAASACVPARSILRRLTWVTLGLSLSAVAGSFFFGRLILRLVYRAEYGSAGSLLTELLIVAAVANWASVSGYGLVAARRFQSYLLSLTTMLVCTTIACAVLIPLYRETGAALACLLGFSAQGLSSWWFLRSELSASRLNVPIAHIVPVSTNS